MATNSKKAAKSKATNTQAALFHRLNEKLSTVGAIQPFEQSVVAKPRTWLLSDMASLNWVLGHGIPFGCLWELCGAEGAGKSTLAYSLAASLQKTHGALVIPYAVETLDDSMFARTGLDPAYMQLPSDEALESIDSITTNMMLILQQIEEMNEEGSYDADYPLPVIMIWDSIAATATSKAVDISNNSEEKASIVKEQMGATANQLTVALKKLLPMFSKTNTLAIFLNQMRVTIDNNSWGGPKEHSGGGRALKHACSIRSKVSYANPYKEFNSGKRDIIRNGQTIGTVVKLEMLKNKLAAPFKTTGFINMFQDGIDLYTSTVLHALYDLAEAQVLPPVVRGRVDYNGKKLYIADLVNAFREDSSAWEELKEKIRQAQIDIDANVTPDDYAAMQRRSDAMEHAEAIEA